MLPRFFPALALLVLPVLAQYLVTVPAAGGAVDPAAITVTLVSDPTASVQESTLGTFTVILFVGGQTVATSVSSHVYSVLTRLT